MSTLHTCGSTWFEEINIAKGIGIVLVLLGHAFPDTALGVKNIWAKGIFDVIYSFHMPLFIFLSGFVAIKILKKSKRKETKTYIIKRAKRLLLPYLTLTFCYLPMKMVMSKFANVPYDIKNIWKVPFGESPDYALWTLYTLFLLSLFSVLLVNEKNIKQWITIFFVIYIIFVLCNINELPAGIEKFFTLGVWYFLGLLAGTKYNKIKEYYTNSKLMIIGLASCIFVVINMIKFIFDFPYERLFIILTSCTGIILILFISNVVSNCSENSLCRMSVSGLGKYCMDIYVLSTFVQPLIRMIVWSKLQLNYALCTVLSVALGATLSILLSKYIIRKIPVLRKLILGIN